MTKKDEILKIIIEAAKKDGSYYATYPMTERMKPSELTGAALDGDVAKCEGVEIPKESV